MKDGQPKTGAQRQKAFKDSQAEAGLVRIEFYGTKEQREKLRLLGGGDWMRRKIDSAKVKPCAA